MTDRQGLGLNPERLELLGTRVQSDIDANQYDGARIIVARRGKVVVDLTAGFNDREKGVALHPDAVFNVMSLTKIMTASMLMSQVERGLVTLTMAVAEIIPEFAQRGKSQITINQLLTHTGGIGIGAPAMPAKDALNLQKMVAAACALPPELPPGEQVSYSGIMAFAVLGEIIRRIDNRGRTYRQILAEDLFQPLGMNDSAIGLPDRLRPKRVPVVIKDNAPELNRAAMAIREELTDEATENAAGGCFASAMDIFRFAEMLRNNGKLGNARILSPATVRLMTQNHTGTMPNNLMMSLRAEHGMAAFPANLGLGLFLRGEGIFPTLFGLAASKGTFGGFGLGSTTLWVDPEREITFVGLTSGLKERVASIIRFQKLADIVFGALQD